MTQPERTLSTDKKAQIFRAFGLRDSDFLSTCFEALEAVPSDHPELYGEVYDRLAMRQLSKLAALGELLKSFQYRPLLSSSENVVSYDVDELISYGPEGEADFVAMIVDFATDRASTPDEALQFEKLLSSGQITRLGLLEHLVERYPDRFSLEDGELFVQPSLKERHVVCHTWRGRLYLHPELKIESAFDEADDCFTTSTGTIFLCPLKLEGNRTWQLSFDLECADKSPIQIRVHDTTNEDALCCASAQRHLVGNQGFFLHGDDQIVEVMVACHKHFKDKVAHIRPNFIRLEQLK